MDAATDDKLEYVLTTLLNDSQGKILSVNVIHSVERSVCKLCGFGLLD